MRILAAIFFCTLALAPSPVSSADPGQVFSTILGEFARQMERQHQQEQLRRLRPLWDACAGGDVAACDRAARFTNLNGRARADIARMREAAELRPAYERNFYACQKSDRAACHAALAYPYLSDADRVNLQRWQREADQRDEVLAAFRRNQQDCYAGSLAACTAAIAERHLDASAIPALERQRASLQAAEEERQVQERQRQAALAALRRDTRACHAGSVAACTAAITNAALEPHARRALENQRTRLNAAARERRKREQLRQAALREYAGLRKSCVDGDRAACRSAATHAAMPAADRAFLAQRERELASLTERLASVFAQPSLGTGSSPNGPSGLTLFGAVVLLVTGFVAVYAARMRVAAPFAQGESPPAETRPAEQPTEPAPGVHFPLTGHMPTDVRRVLADANR